MATKKSSKSTKKDLEAKIANLEKKLEQLSATLESKPAPKPAETKPAETKPAETKPAETKPAETKPAEAKAPPPPPPKPAEVPKPAEAQPAANNAQALETIYYNFPMTNIHDYKTKVPGHTPSPNRYYARLHAEKGTAQTSDWNLQKATLTGYTAPSNQYFATRQRMAAHPADKRFNSLEFGVKRSSWDESTWV